MHGKIIKGIAGFYYVHAEDGVIYECHAKGIFRKENQKPLVGDDVEIVITHEGDKEGNLIRIFPRKNELIRPAVANVDQALVIFAVREPDPNFMLLDRFLVMMEQQNVPVSICFNKTDLGTPEELQKLKKIYEKCGYPMLFASAAEGKGEEEISSLLKGKTTVVAGPSGVGKSSITNLLHGEEEMETGEISKKLKRGRHTTRHSQIIPLGEETYLMDTPGFSSLYLLDMEEGDLKTYFPEFTDYEENCRFLGCSHTHEPACAVKDALEEGQISKIRYENYKMMYEELKEKRRY